MEGAVHHRALQHNAGLGDASLPAFEPREDHLSRSDEQQFYTPEVQQFNMSTPAPAGYAIPQSNRGFASDGSQLPPPTLTAGTLSDTHLRTHENP